MTKAWGFLPLPVAGLFSFLPISESFAGSSFNYLSISICQGCFYSNGFGMLIIILQFCIYVDLCTLFADLVEMNKYSASCNGLGSSGSVMDTGDLAIIHITVDAAMIGEIQGVLGFTGRKGFVIAIVDEKWQTDKNLLLCIPLVCQIQSKREITTNML